MRAKGFEDVFKIMRDQIETHEKKEDGHGETGQYFCSFETEGMSNGGAFPDFEIAEDINDHAYHS